jgi:hypothetical protein
MQIVEYLLEIVHSTQHLCTDIITLELLQEHTLNYNNQILWIQ